MPAPKEKEDSRRSSQGELGRPLTIRIASRVLRALVLIIGAMGLAGWIFDLPLLYSFAPGLIGMKANTAVCFLVIGLALCVVPFHSAPDGTRRFIAGGLAVAPLAIALVNICEYVFRWHTGIDQLFIRDTGPALSNVPPGRMAMGTAAGVVLASTALLLMCARRGGRWRARVLAVCGALVALLGMFSPIGYTAADPSLVGWWRATAMALPTAASLVLTGGAILLFAWQEAHVGWSAERTVALGFVFTIIILAFLSISGYLNDYDMMRSSQAVQHSQEVLNKVQDVLYDVVDAEAGRRGYQITGDKQFLAPYKSGTQQLGADLDGLRKLTADDPGQQRRIAALEPLLYQRLAQFNAGLGLQPDKPEDAERQKALTYQGKATMEKIRAAIAEIQHAEEELLAQRNSAVQAAGHKAFYLEPLGDALSYVAIIVGMVILWGDMSQRRRIEAELRESEERLRLANEAGEIGTYETDFEADVMRFSPEFCRILGLPAGTELSWKESLRLVHAEDRKRAVKEFAASRHPASEGVTRLEFRMVRPGGEVRWVTLRGHTLFRETAAGRVAFRAIGAVVDITERKQTEGALQRAKREWERTFDSVPDLIAILDDQHHILRVNRAIAERLGLQPAQCIGQTCYSCIHGTSKPPENCPHLLTLADHQTHSVELLQERLGGDFLVTTTPLLDDQGRSLGIVHVAHDITELKRAEEERRAVESRLQQSQNLESLGVLAGGIAHDFNNLLTTILGNAELALLELPEGATAARERIRPIQTASQRAAELCREMLAYAGKGRYIVELLDLNRVIEEMGQLLEVSISKKAVLDYKLASKLPPIQADATQIRQVIMNLITNASEAIGDRSGMIYIRTGALNCDRAYLREAYNADHLAEGPYVSLEVSDTGSGIAPEVRDRIFQPFFSTKFAGRGLGLSAVLGIVRAHKGSIKVYCEPGSGATFKVLLPAAAGKAVPEAAVGPPTSEFRGHGTVLVVDDEEGVRAVAKAMLTKAGFLVETAGDGREALETFRRRRDEIACVLLDLMMPQMDGEETFRELRRIRPDVRVILSSGYNEQEAGKRFSGKGLAGFVQKPYRQSELLSVVCSATSRPQ